MGRLKNFAPQSLPALPYTIFLPHRPKRRVCARTGAPICAQARARARIPVAKTNLFFYICGYELYAEYKKVNHKLNVVIDHPPPYIVRQTILYALKNGWTPAKNGGIYDLGNLDEKLDYSFMKEHKKLL